MNKDGTPLKKKGNSKYLLEFFFFHVFHCLSFIQIIIFVGPRSNLNTTNPFSHARARHHASLECYRPKAPPADLLCWPAPPPTAPARACAAAPAWLIRAALPCAGAPQARRAGALSATRHHRRCGRRSCLHFLENVDLSLISVESIMLRC